MQIDLSDPSIYYTDIFARSYHEQTLAYGWAENCALVVSFADISHRDTVLELGAGTGIATKEILKKRPKKVYAVEPSPAMLRMLYSYIDRKEKRRLETIVGTLDDYVKTGNQVDKAIACGLYALWDDPVDELSGIYDALPDTSFSFSVEDWSSAHLGGMSQEEFEHKLLLKARELRIPWVTSKSQNLAYGIDGIKNIIENAKGTLQKYKEIDMVADRDDVKQVMVGHLSPSNSVHRNMAKYIENLLGDHPVSFGTMYMLSTVSA